MQLRKLGNNQTTITKTDGTTILFSYNTPVAAFVPGRGYIRTSRNFSRTTTKHVNNFVGGNADVVDQSEIYALAK